MHSLCKNYDKTYWKVYRMHGDVTNNNNIKHNSTQTRVDNYPLLTQVSEFLFQVQWLLTHSARR